MARQDFLLIHGLGKGDNWGKFLPELEKRGFTDLIFGRYLPQLLHRQADVSVG